MDSAATGFILGYHGCDRQIAEAVYAGKASLRASHNDYDWLGDGIYFWEHNSRRAFDFACEVANRPYPSGQKIKEPAVVGAIVELAVCLNLLDTAAIELVRVAHADMVALHAALGVPMPVNSRGRDLLSRKLDCGVMRMLHQMRERDAEPPLDSVRAAFVEGGSLYPNAGFAAKTHIQICVCNPRCIKGYFRPLDESGKPIIFR